MFGFARNHFSANPKRNNFPQVQSLLEYSCHAHFLDSFNPPADSSASNSLQILHPAYSSEFCGYREKQEKGGQGIPPGEVARLDSLHSLRKVRLEAEPEEGRRKTEIWHIFEAW
jgi:hypothetical protein